MLDGSSHNPEDQGDVPILIRHEGRSANRVFQYFAAKALSRRIPHSVVYGYDLDIFGVQGPPISSLKRYRWLELDLGHDINIDRLAGHINAGLFDAVSLRCWGMRLEYLPDRHIARELIFREGIEVESLVGSDEVLIHLRGGVEFVAEPHPDYPLLPVAYYRAAIQASGRKPVFMGELQDCEYTRLIRASFPEARFLEQRDPLTDFCTIMAAECVIASVSSFCWLACWLSESVGTVFLPVAGLFDPRQRRDVDLLPHRDDRFQIVAFRGSEWRGNSGQMRALSHPIPVTILSPDDVAALKADIAAQSAFSAGVNSRDKARRHRSRLRGGVKRMAQSGLRLLAAGVARTGIASPKLLSADGR